MKIVNVIFWVVSFPIRAAAAWIFVALALGMTDWSSARDRDEVKDVVNTLLAGNLLK
jgi:hypothetical protein